MQKAIRRNFSSTPIIDANPGHKRLKAKQKNLEASLQWKALYAQRVAVERVSSRLKGARSLDAITVRGKWKVTAHCYLAVIAMQAGLLSQYGTSARQDRPSRPIQMALTAHLKWHGEQRYGGGGFGHRLSVSGTALIRKPDFRHSLHARLLHTLSQFVGPKVFLGPRHALQFENCRYVVGVIIAPMQC